jgi:hypothetical protein
MKLVKIGAAAPFMVTTIVLLCSCETVQAALAQTGAPQEKRMTEDMFEVRHISVSIARPPRDVYDFIMEGNNLSQWATGLGTQFQRDGDHWVAQGPLGTASVRLAKRNDFGVADQTVTLESGLTVQNPIRVIANGKGSTVMFTLMRQPGVSEQKFESDAAWVQKDLEGLKMILETR